jgi:hypothetical protein
MRSGEGGQRSWSYQYGGAAENPEGNAFNRIAAWTWYHGPRPRAFQCGSGLHACDRGKNAGTGKLVPGLQWRSEHLMLVDTLGNLPIGKLGREPEPPVQH